MNILVCIKQVPNTRHMSIDPDTHRLIRHGTASILNPADRGVLERALRLRDQHGGTVTVISMGAPHAYDVLLSAHLVGADRCILLTDPLFAGSDTFATASVLAAAVRYEQQRTGTGFVPRALSERSILVDMGRGVRDIDGFDMCCDFADAIGAEIGASRGAVELRLASPKYLIGSNGKTVRPSLYIACGISGSLQHMTAVLDSGCIVAINNDPRAEIRQYADYFVLGDLFEIIPELEKQLKSLL